MSEPADREGYVQRVTLTLVEAAVEVGVSPLTIRKWVALGYLNPLLRNAKPVLFRDGDVYACWFARRPGTWTARMDALSERWRVCVPADRTVSFALPQLCQPQVEG